MTERTASFELAHPALGCEDRLDLEDFRVLVCRRNEPCASLFMSAVPTGPAGRQDHSRIAYLYRAAETSFLERGHRTTDVRSWLSPVEALMEDAGFWRRQSEGLALFVAPGFFRCYRLPLRFEESVVVTERFHIAPLLSFLMNDERCYVLALSRRGCRLLRCSEEGAAAVGLPGAPFSMIDLPGDQPHSDSEGAAADAATCFRAVDRALCEVLRDRRERLMLAGAGHLVALYREISSYPAITEEGLCGNPEGRRDQELAAEAWRILATELARARREVLHRLRENLAAGRGSDRLTDVVPAAVQGRVDVLTAPVRRYAWGRFDPESHVTELHDEQRPTDEDLHELAIVQTILHGGRVYRVAGDDRMMAQFR
ncbi:MAG TPA: hypothetical protein VFS39_10380 [Nitrospira sp.]|nr:hypothetical protein [Nitrospira sp.]